MWAQLQLGLVPYEALILIIIVPTAALPASIGRTRYNYTQCTDCIGRRLTKLTLGLSCCCVLSLFNVREHVRIFAAFLKLRMGVRP